MNNLHPVSRTALVTGSGRNIGRSIAVAIGELGHNVVVNGSADRAAPREMVRTLPAPFLAPAAGPARPFLGK